MPSRVNMGEIAAAFSGVTGPISPFNPLLDLQARNFGQGGVWDFQRVRLDGGGLIFSSQYVRFSNIVIGYAFAAAGGTWQETAAYSNRYAAWRSSYPPGTMMDGYYTYLPAVNVRDYMGGHNDYVATH